MILPDTDRDSPSHAYHDVQYILEHLTQEELEIGARTSVSYRESTPEDIYDGRDETCQRLDSAAAMAERYVCAKSDRDRALQFMKATLAFRKAQGIDKLVRNGAVDPNSDSYKPLRRFLSTKQSYVQGYDKAGRSTYVFVPRLVKEHDPVWTLKGHIWSLERAIACTKSSDKTVNFVVDFSGFNALVHAPPVAIGKEIMQTLRNHYVGHVHRIFLVDAPTTFLWLWAVFKHFAGSKTREKIQFVNSIEEREVIIGEIYAPDEATSWMLPNGSKNRELDVEEYLHDIPFDHAFDEYTIDEQ